VQSKNRVLKEAKVAEIKEKLSKSQGVILSEYQGLTVEQDTELRKKLREAGVEYRVYKNTLVTLAARELGIEGLEAHLQGPVSIAIGYEDPTAPARVLAEFAKTNKKLELKQDMFKVLFMILLKLKNLQQYHQKMFLSQNFLEASKLHFQT